MQFLELGRYEGADADAESRSDVDWNALFRSENEYPFDTLEDDNTTTRVELGKEFVKKLIHLESTKKREWQRLTQTLMSKTQLSNNMETTQKPKTIQNTVQHCHKGNNNEKQNTTTTKRDQSTKIWEIQKNSSRFQHEKGDSKMWTEANLSRMSTNYLYKGGQITVAVMVMQ